MRQEFEPIPGEGLCEEAPNFYEVKQWPFSPDSPNCNGPGDLDLEKMAAIHWKKKTEDFDFETTADGLSSMSGGPILLKDPGLPTQAFPGPGEHSTF